jgi:hypothetical protein
MSYAFIQDVPIDAELYADIRARLGDDTPDGLLVHVVQRLDDGLRYVDVWESEEQCTRFHDERLMPLVLEAHAAHGVVPDPSRIRLEVIDVIDTWVGSALVG